MTFHRSRVTLFSCVSAATCHRVILAHFLPWRVLHQKLCCQDFRSSESLLIWSASYYTVVLYPRPGTWVDEINICRFMCHELWALHVVIQDAQLSQRDRAAGCVI